MTLAIRLPKDLEKRLNNLAKETGRTKTYYICKALSKYLDNIEDLHIAHSRIENPGRKWSMQEVKATIKRTKKTPKT